MSGPYLNKIMSCSTVPQLINNKNKVTVNGKVDLKTGDPSSAYKIVYWAANPPNYNSSYSGSGLPFPNPEIAYENTPNLGVVQLDGNNYSFDMLFPNSYYSELGTVYNEPRFFMKLCSNSNDLHDIRTIMLNNPIPYRSLTYAAPTLTMPRTTGTCGDRNNVELACNTYGMCNLNAPTKVGQLESGCMPFFYTDFYQQSINPIRSQQQILWESKYPDKMEWYPNFWGNKPPQ